MESPTPPASVSYFDLFHEIQFASYFHLIESCCIAAYCSGSEEHVLQSIWEETEGRVVET